MTAETTQPASTLEEEPIPLMNSAVLKNPLVTTPDTSSAAVDAMLGMLLTGDGDSDGEVDPPKHSDDGVLTIQWEGIPLCEWNEMDPPKHSDDGVLTIQSERIPLCKWNEMDPSKHSDDGV